MVQYLDRRGADRAEIYSICFSPNSHFLACSSDKCTVHVFALTADGSGGATILTGDHPMASIPRYYIVCYRSMLRLLLSIYITCK